MIEEGYQNPHHTSNQCAIKVKPLAPETNKEATQSQERKTGTKAINTVNHINGIHDEHHDKYGQQGTGPIADVVDTAEAIKRVDAESCHWDERGRYNLCTKLNPGIESYEVIKKTCEIDDRKTDEEIERPEIGLYGAMPDVWVHHQYDNRECQQHIRHEDDTPQPWNGVFVDFSFVGDIVDTFTLTEI